MMMLLSAALKEPKWMGLAERSDMRWKALTSDPACLAGAAETPVAARREARTVNFMVAVDV